MTCEKCGYIPWPGEKGCSSCQEIKDKQWEAAAPAVKQVQRLTRKEKP